MRLRKIARFVLVIVAIGVLVGLVSYLLTGDAGRSELFGIVAMLVAMMLYNYLGTAWVIVILLKDALSTLAGALGAMLGVSWFVAQCLLAGEADPAILIGGGIFFGGIGAVIGYIVDIAALHRLWMGPCAGLTGAVVLVMLRPDDLRAADSPILSMMMLAAFGAAAGGVVELLLRSWLDPSFSGRSGLTKAQRWALALGGPLTHVNQEPFDALDSTYGSDGCRRLLRDGWNTRDEEDAAALCGWLLEEGHDAEYQQMLAAIRGMNDTEFEIFCEQQKEDRRQFCRWVRKHMSKSAARDIIAWDMGRLVQYARWCHEAGYFSESEAWDWIMRAAARSHVRYRSWDEFLDHYRSGYRYSFGSGPQGDGVRAIERAVRWMKDHDDSPCRELSWRFGRKIADVGVVAQSTGNLAGQG